jgi:hypothetical protein
MSHCLSHYVTFARLDVACAVAFCYMARTLAIARTNAVQIADESSGVC